VRAARAERQLAEAQALLAARAPGQHRARQHRVLRRHQQHLRASAAARSRGWSLARGRLRAAGDTVPRSGPTAGPIKLKAVTAMKF